MTAFAVRVSDETASKLEQIAEKLDRSRSYTAAQAIEDYVAREEWQLAEIEAGLVEADRGEFASEEDVAKVVGKYVRSVRQSGVTNASAGHCERCGVLMISGHTSKMTPLMPQPESSRGS